MFVFVPDSHPLDSVLHRKLKGSWRSSFFICITAYISADCWAGGGGAFSHPASLLSPFTAWEVHQPVATRHKVPGNQVEGETASPELWENQRCDFYCETAGPGWTKGPAPHRWTTLSTQQRFKLRWIRTSCSHMHARKRKSERCTTLATDPRIDQPCLLLLRASLVWD